MSIFCYYNYKSYALNFIIFNITKSYYILSLILVIFGFMDSILKTNIIFRQMRLFVLSLEKLLKEEKITPTNTIIL